MYNWLELMEEERHSVQKKAIRIWSIHNIYRNDDAPPKYYCPSCLTRTDGSGELCIVRTGDRFNYYECNWCGEEFAIEVGRENKGIQLK